MIRFAEEKDIEEILALAKKEYNRTPYRDIEFDVSVARRNLLSAIKGDRETMIILVVDNNKIDGVLGAVISTMLCSDEKVATELVWSLSDSCSSRDAVKLFRAYEYWQYKVGCKISTVSNYKKKTFRGYKPAEQVLVRINK